MMQGTFKDTLILEAERLKKQTKNYVQYFPGMFPSSSRDFSTFQFLVFNCYVTLLSSSSGKCTTKTSTNIMGGSEPSNIWLFYDY